MTLTCSSGSVRDFFASSYRKDVRRDLIKKDIDPRIGQAMLCVGRQRGHVGAGYLRRVESVTQHLHDRFGDGCNREDVAHRGRPLSMPIPMLVMMASR